MRLPKIFTVLLFVMGLNVLSAQTYDTETKLLAGDGDANEYFGANLAISGRVAVVANYINDVQNRYLNNDVYVYKFEDGNWIEQQILSPSDNIESDFGSAIAISEDLIVVGAHYYHNPNVPNLIDQNQAGAAYVFRYNGSRWIEEQILFASDAEVFDEFGTAVAVDGNRIIIGVPNKDGDLDPTGDPYNTAGQAYIFEFDGSFWNETTQLFTLSRENDKFGSSVSISGDLAIVGSPEEDDRGAQSGSVFSFKYDGSTWQREPTIYASDGAANDRFGSRVFLEENRMIVGASTNDIDNGGDDRGAAYIFDYIDNSWIETQRLVASDRANNDRFGGSVALSGDKAIVGAILNEAAYVFKWNGSTWNQSSILTASDRGPSDLFGGNVALNNAFALVSSRQDDDNGIQSGSVYIYELIAQPKAEVSNGKYNNRNTIKWENRSKSQEGFRIYRDGEEIATTISAARSYNDYQAIPGVLHNYNITAYNANFGESNTFFNQQGWRKADGRIDGTIRTRGQAGAPNVKVSVIPADSSAVNSLLFDGVDDYIKLPFISMPDTFTISAWIKTTTSSSHQQIIGWGSTENDHLVRLKNQNGVLAFEKTDGGPEPLSEIIGNIRIDSGNWEHVAAVMRGDSLSLYVNGILAADEELTSFNPDLNTINIAAGKPGAGFITSFAGGMDEVQLWNRALSTDDITKTMFKALDGSEAGLISYWSFDDLDRINLSFAGDYAIGGGNHGEIKGAIRSRDIPAGVNPYTITDVNGDYSIKNLFYAEGRDFNIVPSKPNHGFQPAQLRRNLDSNTPTMLGVNLTDTTSFTVSGRISFANYNSCAVEDVLIEQDGVYRGVKTNSNGEFRLSIDTPGSYMIAPVLTDSSFSHGFLPSEITLNVNDDISGLVFIDTTTSVLAGRVGASCLYLGTANINIKTEDSCIDTTITTNITSGSYKLVLPSKKYTVSLIDNNFTNPDVIAPSKDVVTVDLTYKDTTDVDFIYHNPPQIKISGLPEICADAADPYRVPVVGQYQNYNILIEVFEEYDGQICIVDTGFLVITGDIGENPNKSDTLKLVNGQAEYSLIVGEPNILEGGQHPFQKVLRIEADVDGLIAFHDEWMIVTGNKPRTSTFTTETGPLPLLIVHDPPGDQSYSYFLQGSSTTLNNSISYGTGGSGGVWWETKHGFKWATAFLETSVAFITEGQVEAGRNNISQESWSSTLTFDKTFKTSDGDAITGKDADVFMGAGMNLIYALTDVIEFDTTSCLVVQDTTLSMAIEGFKTTFIYTEEHIRNTIIPQLESLRPLRKDKELIELNRDISNWQQMLAHNDSLHKNSKKIRNISFSAGTNTEYTSSYTKEDTWNFEFEAFVEAEVKLGLENTSKAGAWAESKFGVLGKFRYSTTTGIGRSKTDVTTTSYVLGDDDTGDFFSVDIKNDRTYGTPVFELVSGTSSCPWEAGTQPRDKPVLSITSKQNGPVAPDEKAAFILSIGNESESGETRDYNLSVVQSSNYDGAIISVGGVVIEDNLAYTIPAGQSINATMTVERGPLAYDYNDLQLQLTSACDGTISETINFSVEFTNPGSNVELFRPYENWLVNQTSGDSMLVTLRGFNRDAPDLKSISLEYRKRGDSWKTVFLREKETLTENYINYYWDHSNLPDGTYELRAVAKGAGVNYSQLSIGNIDRSSLLVFGNPLPTDGVLNLGDNIQVNFTSDLDCDEIYTQQNVLLQDENGDLIDIDLVCSEKSLIITPKAALSSLEGKRLKASVKDIKDVNGNPLRTPVSWEFTVNQNAVYWVNSNVHQVIYSGETNTFASTLSNTGGISSAFAISSLPAWLSAEPMNGSITAGGSLDINFTIDNSLNRGAYSDSAYATVSGQADEILTISLDVLETPPSWQVLPSAYQYSMNVIAQISNEDVVSANDKDVVAAFVGNEIRGKANVQYVSDEAGYLAFLTVYSNQASGEIVNFRTWDASQSIETGFVAQTLDFENNATRGQLEIPVVLKATGRAQNIDLNPNWTWFSLNLEYEDMSVNSVLGALDASNGDVIKGQSGISTYTGKNWVGDLDTLEVGQSYRIFLRNEKDLRFAGDEIDLAGKNIPVLAGWNWIGYLPQTNVVIDSALSAFSAADGDLLKSQTGFSVYDASGTNWQGGISVMKPGDGYLLRTANDGFISYSGAIPAKVSAAGRKQSSKQDDLAAITIDAELRPQDFEFNMSIIGEIRLGGTNISEDNYVVTAYRGDSLRGRADLTYFPDVNKHMLFMTIYGNNQSGDSLTFQINNSLTGFEIPATNILIFTSDAIAGTFESPYVISGFDETPPDLMSAFLHSTEPGLANRLQLYITASEPLLDAPLVRIASSDGSEQAFMSEVFDRDENIYRLKYHVEQFGENTFFILATDLSENLTQEVRKLNVQDINLIKNSVITIDEKVSLHFAAEPFENPGIFYGEHVENSLNPDDHGLERISDDYIFSASSELNEGFVIHYDLSKVALSKEEKRKIGLYRFDTQENIWIHQGGESLTEQFTEQIQSLGKYALFYDESKIVIPREFRLLQNYPNPFNPQTTIEFELPEAADVKLSIYDITGQRVKLLVDEETEAGYHKVLWNGLNQHGNRVASGIYIYQIRTASHVANKKMILIK